MNNQSESIFGHIAETSTEYNPPIPLTDVHSLVAELSVRPTKDDENISPDHVFSSDKTVSLLTSKLTTADLPFSFNDTLETSYNSAHPTKLWNNLGNLAVGETSPTALSVDSADSEVATISSGVLSFPTIKIASVNTIIGSNAATYSAVGRTSLFGRDAGYNAGNCSDVVGIGWQSGYMATHSMYSTYCGTQSGKYRRQQHSTCVGRFAGGLASVGQGAGSAGYTHNTYLGSSCGAGHLSGSNCLYLGAGVNEANGDSRLLIGAGSDHLITGTFGTPANASIDLNADSIKVPSTIKTQVDLANLAVGQVYVDTSAGNTLRVKL